MPLNSLNYTKAAVIVHGKSEFHLVRYIYTNLHLTVKIIAENKGRKSIQIDGLKEYLNKNSFKSLSKFANEYSVEYDKKEKRLINFKLFIIMDTDDCSEKMREAYITGKLFAGHPLEKYIVPIYNISNLEDVMIKAGIMVERISASEKGTYYSRIFPINTEPLSVDTIEQIQMFAQKLKNVKETNMLEFVEYCMEQIPDAKLWEDSNKEQIKG